MTVKNCFNKAATIYDNNCSLQLRTGAKLLNLAEGGNEVIDLGCGTGIITSRIKFNKLYALDISEKMLLKAREYLANKNVTFLEKSFDKFYGFELDLAFANMSLQWSDNFKSTLNNIKNNLKKNGILVFSIPLQGTFLDLPVNVMQFLSISQVKKMLEDWELLYSSTEEINYIFPSLIDSLRSIKSVGANYCKSNKNRKIIPRDKGFHTLVYNIGYFKAKKI